MQKSRFNVYLNPMKKAFNLALMSSLFVVGLVQSVFAQRTITGKVTDATDKSDMIGVTVSVKGTTTGTQTDIEGKYSIKVPSNDAILSFTFIGKISKEVAVGTQSEINVTLEDDALKLEEIVVVGYGTQKKKDLTGSITSVTSTDFVKGNIQTPEQLVTGKLAGVQITTNGGAPGSGSRIRIRGGSSLNASNDPLIVIDGVPIDNAGLSGSANPLSFINPNDIESFNVLKDASAAAIYGSRAANGVIIITTKKGKSGSKTNVAFSTLFSVANKVKNVDVLTADEFTQAVNTYGTAAQKALLGTANTNWQDEIYRTALSSDNNLSLTGSAKNVPYRVSVGYLNQNGILQNSNLQRTSGSIGLTPTLLDKHLKIDLNLKVANNVSNFADEGAIGSAIGFDPTKPVYSSEMPFGGYYQWPNKSGGIEALAPSNPLALLNLKTDKGILNRYIGNIQLDYKFHFLEDLRAVVNAGFDRSNTDGNKTVDKNVSANALTNGGETGFYTQNRNNQTFQAYLNYVKELSNQRFDIMGGYEYQQFLREEESGTDYGNTAVVPLRYYFKTENKLDGLFGRLNYGLMGKYLATFTLRRDGSSRFSPDTRYGLFPSAALAWNINEELKNSDTFSDLRLRLGWGVTGQQDLTTGDYPYLPVYSPSQGLQYQFGGTFYDLLRANAYDANIKWEETQSSNVGLDFGLRKSRISGSVDVYLKKTIDLINEIDVPAGANFSNRVITNVGSMENKGVELTLNYSPIQKADFTWDLNFNFTYNTNKITALTKNEGDNYIGVLTGNISGGTGAYGQIHTTGYPRSSFFLYQQVYDQNGKPIEGVFVDRNQDGVITELDRYRYQNPDPNYFLGLTSQTNYKNLSFGFVMRSNINNYVYNNVFSGRGSYASMTGAGNVIFNLASDVLNSGFSSNTNRERIILSDYFVQNASFLRMDNLNVGYNLGSLANNKVKNAQLSFIVQNVFTVTKYQGLDPEVAGGIDNQIYPRPRTFSLGLNVNF